jgi:hypothetical protein
VIHHQVAGVVLQEEAAHLHDVGMAQRGQHLGLLVEQSQAAVEVVPVLVVDRLDPVVESAPGQLLGQELLDDHLVLGVLVLRHVDEAEAAAGDHFHDHITVDDGAFGEAVAQFIHAGDPAGVRNAVLSDSWL